MVDRLIALFMILGIILRLFKLHKNSHFDKYSLLWPLEIKIRKQNKKQGVLFNIEKRERESSINKSNKFLSVDWLL